MDGYGRETFLSGEGAGRAHEPRRGGGPVYEYFASRDSSPPLQKGGNREGVPQKRSLLSDLQVTLK